MEELKDPIKRREILEELKGIVVEAESFDEDNQTWEVRFYPAGDPRRALMFEVFTGNIDPVTLKDDLIKSVADAVAS